MKHTVFVSLIYMPSLYITAKRILMEEQPALTQKMHSFFFQGEIIHLSSLLLPQAAETSMIALVDLRVVCVYDLGYR